MTRGRSPLNVRLAEDKDGPSWDSFVEGNPKGTFFHRFGWRQVIEDELQHEAIYMLAEMDGDIVGVLPLAHVKTTFFGNALISTPFLVYGGPVSDSDAVHSALIDAAVNEAKTRNVDYLEVRSRENLRPEWPTKTDYVTFRRTICSDNEANLKDVPRKQRAMIRKASAAGLLPRVDDNVESLYNVLTECKRNLGTPFFGKSLLKRIKDVFGDQVEVLSILNQQQVICAVMSFKFRDEILPYYGGGGKRAREASGNDFMYWAVLSRAAESGQTLFDFGRSKRDTGAFNFKRNWGFSPETLFYQYYLVRSKEIPQNSPTNPKYALFVSLWRRLPLPLARILGPYLARQLA